MSGDARAAIAETRSQGEGSLLFTPDGKIEGTPTNSGIPLDDANALASGGHR